jgi:hypothetical protein
MRDYMRAHNNKKKPQNKIPPIYKILEHHSDQIGQQTDLFDSKPELRMSQVIAEFIEPYRCTVQNLSDFHILVSFAISAWNLAVMPEKKREEKFKILSSVYALSKHNGYDKLLRIFIRRKIEY